MLYPGINASSAVELESNETIQTCLPTRNIYFTCILKVVVLLPYAELLIRFFVCPRQKLVVPYVSVFQTMFYKALRHAKCRKFWLFCKLQLQYILLSLEHNSIFIILSSTKNCFGCLNKNNNKFTLFSHVKGLRSLRFDRNLEIMCLGMYGLWFLLPHKSWGRK